MNENNTIIYVKSNPAVIDKNELKWNHINWEEIRNKHAKTDNEINRLIDQLSEKGGKLKMIEGSIHEIPYKDENTIIYTEEFPA